MPDNQRNSSPKIAPRPTWSGDSLKSNDTESKTVIRKFINSAIYVEKSVMPPLRKKSPIFQNSLSDGEYTSRTIVTDRSIKRCTCISLPKKCPCHPIKNLPKSDDASDSSNTSSSSQITVKSKQFTLPKIETGLRLSLSSLSTDRTGNIDPKEKDEIIRQWLKKKDEEKKRLETHEAKIREAEARQRELMLKKEQENFKKWLANKKAQEERVKIEKEKNEQEKVMKEAEKQKKQAENEAKYNEWLKKKQRAELGRKKIKEKLTLLEVYREKQRRMEENEKAFNEWLENSKNKPKPVPLNQGLQSLCSSTSITYINPVPWIPNVEISQKPISQ